MTPDDETAESLLPEELAEASVGDAVVVRTDWGGIIAGALDRFNRDTELDPGDWLILISDPVLWDVSEPLDDRGEGGEVIQLDFGEPLDYYGEKWDGLKATIAWGSGRFEEGLGGDIIVRTPEPVFDRGGVRNYKPLPAGRVEEVDVSDAPADPAVLLTPDDPKPVAGEGNL